MIPSVCPECRCKFFEMDDDLQNARKDRSGRKTGSKEKPMCEICEKVKTVDFFPTPKAYLDCLKYIQSLVDSGSFQFGSKDCDTDKVKDENGCWIDDVICHVIIWMS